MKGAVCSEWSVARSPSIACTIQRGHCTSIEWMGCYDERLRATMNAEKNGTVHTSLLRPNEKYIYKKLGKLAVYNSWGSPIPLVCGIIRDAWRQSYLGSALLCGS